MIVMTYAKNNTYHVCIYNKPKLEKCKKKKKVTSVLQHLLGKSSLYAVYVHCSIWPQRKIFFLKIL